EIRDGFSLGDFAPCVIIFLAGQFKHFCLDSGQLLRRQCSVSEIYIVVKSVFYRRSDTKLDAGIQPFKSFCHEVCGAVPEGVFAAFIIPRKELEGSIFLNRTKCIPNHIIDFGCQHIAGKAITDRPGNLHCRSTLWVFSDRSVGERYFNHAAKIAKTQDSRRSFTEITTKQPSMNKKTSLPRDAVAWQD